MSVYRIELNEVSFDNAQNAPKFWIVETKHPDLTALCEDLRSGPVVVNRMFTKRTDDANVFAVYARADVIITQHGVKLIEVPPRYRYVDHDAAWEPTPPQSNPPLLVPRTPVLRAIDDEVALGRHLPRAG